MLTFHCIEDKVFVLNTDEKGLRFEADLFDTTASRDVYTLIKQGGLDKCSFAFTIEEDEYNKINHLKSFIRRLFKKR